MRFRERRTRRLAVLCLALLAGLGAVRLHAQTGGPPKNETKNEIKAVPWGDFDYRKAANQNRYLVEIPATGTKGGNSPLAVKPAPNMEPVMLHPVQIQEAVDNLQNRGYCAATLARSCPTCKIDPAKEKGCKHPNILIFLTDDMGWSDYGAYGGGATFGAVTPNIDRLAHEGLMLTSTYAQPSCSPTRATIHTGQLPVHHGVLYPPMYGDPGGITERSLPLPWVLQGQGYRTQGVGKWHMGENPENLPQVNGYDDYYGFLSVSDMYTEWRDQYYNPEVVRDERRTTYMDNNKFSHYLIHATPAKGCQALAEITIPWEAKALNEENAERIKSGQETIPNRGNPNNCTPVYKEIDNDPLLNQLLTEKFGHDIQHSFLRVSLADLDKLWAEYSVKFIHDQVGKSQPWFLYHATRGCHFDNYPQNDDRRVSYARTIYSECTVEIDDILGKLMGALRETGLDKDTLVFLSSDNGPEDEIPPHGHTPFRGGKGSTWEGGVRVPGIAYWPGMVQAGRTSDGLFDLADLYTTTLTLAGFDYAHPEESSFGRAHPEAAELIKNRYLYGIDQTSFLLTKDGESSRRSVLNWFLTDFAAVRMDEFKAHRMVTEPLGLSRGYPGGFSGFSLPSSYLLMFNLQESPKEDDNIAIRHLWAQHLFTNEFGRFMCVLVEYPPHLPTQPNKELIFLSQIDDMREHPAKWQAACHPFEVPKKDASQ